MERIYDIIVIGGGPAGYTAAMYGARAGLDVLLIEKMSAGGQMNQTNLIENYPGFEEGIDGFSLGQKMQAGAERAGVKTVYASVRELHLEGHVKTAETETDRFLGRTVILATGAGHKHLGIADEEALVGRGVAYCAVCDGMFYRGKTVAVVGGGNSAAADALYLARIAKKVYIIHRRDSLRASKSYRKQLEEAENVEILWNRTVERLLHGQKLTGVMLRDNQTGGESWLELDGLFISVGRSPETALVAGKLELDNAGYIMADESTQTSVPGVFAAGDVRTKKVRQIVTAVADGAAAVYQAEEYLADRNQ